MTTYAQFVAPGEENEIGLYVGPWCPQVTYPDERRSLTRLFDVYVYPNKSGFVPSQDVDDYMTGIAACKGARGGPYATDRAIYEALLHRDYKGEWVVPPAPVAQMLVRVRHQGALARIFGAMQGYLLATSTPSHINGLAMAFNIEELAPCLVADDVVVVPVRLFPRQCEAQTNDAIKSASRLAYVV